MGALAQAAALIALARELKLDLFSLQRQEAGLASLLGLVAELLFKHADAGAVDACLRTLLHCATSGPDTLQVLSPSASTSEAATCVGHYPVLLFCVKYAVLLSFVIVMSKSIAQDWCRMQGHAVWP